MSNCTLRETPGVSVMIYDQICATEKRRRAKRGLRAAGPDARHHQYRGLRGLWGLLAEIQLPVGRTCRNTDSWPQAPDQSIYVQYGSFLPAWLLSRVSSRSRMANRPGQHLDRPPFSDRWPAPAGNSAASPSPYNVLFTGVGGTGVTTVAAVLAMAAHVDGHAASSLDMTGLAQKGGPVLSHIRFAREPDLISTGRVPPGQRRCGDRLRPGCRRGRRCAEPDGYRTARPLTPIPMSPRPANSSATGRRDSRAIMLSARVKSQAAATSIPSMLKLLPSVICTMRSTPI